MDLKPLTMDQDSAEAMYEEYRALGDRSNEDDAAIMTMLREVRKGRALIDLDVAIPAGGCDDLGRPKLAISRADQLEVKAQRDYRSLGWDDAGKSRGGESTGDLHFLPSDRFRHERIAESLAFDVAGDLLAGWPSMLTAFALVPPVPPRFRPRGALSRYAILWEVDEWADKSKFAPPPRDPALLRHIAGSLYAILAVWDLTDIERLVLGMTRRS